MFESECGLRTVYTEPAVSIGLVRDEYWVYREINWQKRQTLLSDSNLI